MAEARRSRLAGWPLVGWAALGLSAMVALVLAGYGTGVEGWRVVIRATARTSAVLFCAAFAASSLHVLRPRPATRWLLRNRRYLGVSFAVSHAYHLLGIIMFMRVDESVDISAVTLIGGGLGFVFIAALTATSFDRSAALLGPRRWKRLHKTGVYYLWFIFVLTFAPEAIEIPIYPPFVLLLAAAFVLRIAAWRKVRASYASAVPPAR